MPVNATAAVKPTVKAPEAKKEKAAVATNAAKKDAAQETDPAAVMASLHLPSLKLKGKAALAPMLAMLKGLYEDSKDRISQQNLARRSRRSGLQRRRLSTKPSSQRS